jgi:hypothetical protein
MPSHSLHIGVMPQDQLIIFRYSYITFKAIGPSIYCAFVGVHGHFRKINGSSAVGVNLHD